MPDMTITIGGKPFTVACQEGEEAFLQSAADLLDKEAQVLVQGGARLTQERMLLMAGLMLADKNISADEELRALDRRLAQQTKVIDDIKSKPAPEPEVREVEVVREVVPDGAVTRLDALAERIEALARKAGAPA